MNLTQCVVKFRYNFSENHSFRVRLEFLIYTRFSRNSLSLKNYTF